MTIAKLSRAIALCLCTMLIVCSTVMAHDYTEEQVQAAKNWLSSHGYPPTEAGANQAYADFENGMWHDDPAVMAYLGITPAPTVAPTEIPNSSVTPGPTDASTGGSTDGTSGVNDNTNAVTEPSDNTTNSSGETTEANNPGSTQTTESETDATEDISEEAEASEEPTKDDEEVKKQNEEVRKRENRSKILTFVIIGAAVVVVLVSGFVFLKKKR